MTSPLLPSATLLLKLGSALVHAEEFLSPTGHEVDLVAFKSATEDAEVVAWLTEMTKQGFLPVRR